MKSLLKSQSMGPITALPSLSSISIPDTKEKYENFKRSFANNNLSRSDYLLVISHMNVR